MPAVLLTDAVRGSLPGPENVIRQELSNGIVVLGRANPSSSSVVVVGSLRAGGLFDPDEKLGLADFTSAALMRGTHSRSFSEIYEALESIGASLGFSGGTHLVSFAGKALVEDLDILLALLSEALRQPAFPPEQVERLRSQMLTSLAIRAQDTAEMASLAFDELAYPNHPYRRPEAGFPETVQAILPEDLAAFHSLHYGPDGMLIAIVGGIDPRQAIDKVRLAVEDWHNPHQLSPPPLPPLQPLVQLSTRHIPIPGKSQSDLVLGAPGPPRLSPDFMAASLGNHILGRFGMMGRLGEALREKTGLAYYAGSSLSGGLGPGPWEISAGVDPLNLDRALDLVRAEIRRFVNEPVSAQELADSQANYIGRLPISMESNAGLASALLALERFQLGLDHYLHYPDLVAEVTPVRILEAARRYLDPDRLAIATAGP